MHRTVTFAALSCLLVLGATIFVQVVQNVELQAQNEVRDSVARTGIEGEGDIPMPVA